MVTVTWHGCECLSPLARLTSSSGGFYVERESRHSLAFRTLFKFFITYLVFILLKGLFGMLNFEEAFLVCTSPARLFSRSTQRRNSARCRWCSAAVCRSCSAASVFGCERANMSVKRESESKKPYPMDDYMMSEGRTSAGSRHGSVHQFTAGSQTEFSS